MGAEQSGKIITLDGYFGNAAIKVLILEEVKRWNKN
jgi:hypothetical protein